MRAYSQDYLNDVVENQGKLFDFVAQTYPDKDTEDFIKTYMTSKTRKSIDEAKAYVNTMDAKELWKYFTETEKYSLKSGKALDGFMPDWIGEFYAYYQWYYNIPSTVVLKKIPLDFIKKHTTVCTTWNLIWQCKKSVKCDEYCLLSQSR